MKWLSFKLFMPLPLVFVSEFLASIFISFADEVFDVPLNWIVSASLGVMIIFFTYEIFMLVARLVGPVMPR